MSSELNKNKKQFLLKTLKTLIPTWNLAQGFYLIVQDMDETDEAIDAFIKIIQKSVNNIKDENSKKLMKASLDRVKKMQQEEKHEVKIEKNEAEELLKMLE